VALSPVNQSPIAIVGSVQYVDEGTLVTLDGSRSTDDGKIGSYEWREIPGETVKLSSQLGAKVTFLAPRVGKNGKILRFRLTVIDDKNVRGEAEVTVHIGNTKNDPPIADAGRGRVVTQGEEVVLNGANSSDADGVDTITTYYWVQDSTDAIQVELNDVFSPSLKFTAPVVSDDAVYVLRFRLSVTDEEGESALANVVINVSPGEDQLRPVADAGADQTVAPGSVVQLDGSNSKAGSSDGVITSYHWALPNSEIVLFDANPVFTVPAEFSNGSQMEFTLTVTDADGLVGTDTVVINVGKNPPTVDVGKNQIVQEGTTVTLIGRAYDNGRIETRRWRQVGGGEVEVVLESPLSDDGVTTFVTPIIESGAEIPLTFEFQATDDEHISSTGVVEVLVQDNGIVKIKSDYLPVWATPFSPESTLDMVAPIGFKPPPEDQGHIVLLEALDPGAVDIKQGLPRRMPYGLFNMHIKTEQLGGSVTVDIQLSSPAPLEPNDYVWYKYDDEAGWEQNVQVSRDRLHVTLELTDGGVGDSDKIADGIIRVRSGLGQVSEAVLFSGSSGGGSTGLWALVGLGLFFRLRRVCTQ
jgi:MYXO-CTERM domain-containing protein